jgi:hypothetical protein
VLLRMCFRGLGLLVRRGGGGSMGKVSEEQLQCEERWDLTARSLLENWERFSRACLI